MADITPYAKGSPYYGTQMYGTFLDVWQNRSVTKDAADVLYTIDSVYKYRPDLLAFDLYGDPALWWVFAVRNPNILKDPLFDFYPGITIYLPKKDNLVKDLGL